MPPHLQVSRYLAKSPCMSLIPWAGNFSSLCFIAGAGIGSQQPDVA
jgi:hypothetical protein